MSKYLILERQEESGCDYTIGCGMCWYFEDFDGTLAEAVDHFTHRVVYPDGIEEGSVIDGDNPHTEVWVVPTERAVMLDLKKIREEEKKLCAAAEKEKKLARDRAEFEHLKKQFE